MAEPERYFREVVLAYDGNDCLAWPFAKTGKGTGLLWQDGRLQRVTRLVCRKVHGPAPTPKHEAAHSCGKGHESCCTKRHLSWKTKIENEADKIGHGTLTRGERHGMAKLTEPQARKVLALKGVMPQRDIAALFGVNQVHIGRIHRGESWAWLEGTRQ